MILSKSKLAALASHKHAADGGRVERTLLSLAKGMVAVPVHETWSEEIPLRRVVESVSLKMWMRW